MPVLITILTSFNQIQPNRVGQTLVTPKLYTAIKLAENKMFVNSKLLMDSNFAI